ncbi:MAG: IS66 family insertion sequence element accessory protein TnpB [Oligoflexia bacterium]|nr:IS66 family insertion sequence element accessory protein TnpB [Oligoflexia bacterium]
MSIQVTLQSRIFICQEPLDFRCGFNGTAAACRLKIQKNPLEGGLFVFINQSRTMIRLYLFDGHGELLITKKVAQGRFPWWNTSSAISEGSETEIMIEHIHLLLRGGDPKSVRLPPPWKKI